MTAGSMEASERLLAEKEGIARWVTDALYGEKPELLERWGERGRTKCLQDMRYNVEHLAPAVALGEPALFARYVEWLREMLGARGIPVDDIRRCLELMGDAARSRLPADAAEAVVAGVEAGLGALGTEAKG